ncbi:hypothetical protein M0813_19314 [Anaeramoeba flamelloides]|uniref:4-alpha-glucanotransferase n=1 Tax=Anaeramoeba flamelloides TaxID=1746091 RepID=A0ABQ8YPJ6_9EUKA|nr:hypothetical protein M0813_19314 [Anaeramoeba flamelloides]
MELHFITNHELTKEGNKLCVVGSWNHFSLENSTILTACKQKENQYEGVLNIECQETSVSVEYRYVEIPDEQDLDKLEDQAIWEEDCHRKVHFKKGHQPPKLICYDSFTPRYKDEDFILQTSPFYQVFYSGKKAKESKGNENLQNEVLIGEINENEIKIRFSINAFCVPKGKHVYLMGSATKMGSMEYTKAVRMQPADYSQWKSEFLIKKSELPLTYKFVIKGQDENENENENENELWYDQKGERKFTMEMIQESNKLYYVNDYSQFQFHEEILKQRKLWRIAGVSVPIFSLRTRNSLGIGEFLDLKPFADWASRAHLKLIQILPVSDTNVFGENTEDYEKKWHDSYPYSSLSSIALNPIYITLDRLPLSEELKEEIEKNRNKFNQEIDVDYPEVISFKMKVLRKIFESLDKDEISNQVSDFVKENESWLPAYALLRVLINEYKCFDRSQKVWDKYRKIDLETVLQLCSPKSERYLKVLFWYWVQYNLSIQLIEANKYLNSKDIIMMGDLPIGVDKCSSDVWLNPHLFRLHKNAGAPPDYFSMDGQNWLFPTYDWEEMAKDGYKWWKQRFHNMEKYMQVLRIDHILGFFRIWEVDPKQVKGMFGIFHKSLPFTREELKKLGIENPDEWSKPRIEKAILKKEFVNDYPKFLEEIENKPGFYKFKDKYVTQRDIKKQFPHLNKIKDEEKREHMTKLKNELLMIFSYFAFTKEGDKYHPRITIRFTRMYRELPFDLRMILREIHNKYYFRRHNKLWAKEGNQKLSRIMSVTKMLLVAEDLGMIPKCVPRVLKQLRIPCMNVERMPRKKKNFNNCEDYEYISYCTTGTHDTENLREWWVENFKWEKREIKEKLEKIEKIKKKVSNQQEKVKHLISLSSEEEEEEEEDPENEDDDPEDFSNQILEKMKLWNKKLDKNFKNNKKRLRSEEFYHTNIGFKEEEIPKEFSTEMVKRTLTNFVNSKSMICVFPLQDLFALTEGLRRPIKEERINLPSDNHHHWKYRMQLNIEDLIQNHEDFTNEVSQMIDKSDRF